MDTKVLERQFAIRSAIDQHEERAKPRGDGEAMEHGVVLAILAAVARLGDGDGDRGQDVK